jgi:hypothetical protein
MAITSIDTAAILQRVEEIEQRLRDLGDATDRVLDFHEAYVVPTSEAYICAAEAEGEARSCIEANAVEDLAFLVGHFRAALADCRVWQTAEAEAMALVLSHEGHIAKIEEHLRTALADTRRVDEDAEGLRDCLRMIREDLEDLLGREAMAGVPPMNYNDVIRDVMLTGISIYDAAAYLVKRRGLSESIHYVKQRQIEPTERGEAFWREVQGVLDQLDGRQNTDALEHRIRAMRKTMITDAMAATPREE